MKQKKKFYLHEIVKFGQVSNGVTFQLPPLRQS